MSERKPIAEVRCTCGRNVLFVGGFALAMEGDKCRDGRIPEEVREPIPEPELAAASIGGVPAKDLPPDMVRFFRGDCWTTPMLEYVAERINAAS
jgi:hypothetical protein